MEASELIKKYPEKSPIFMISMKRRVYWMVQVCFAAFLGFFLNLGYNGIFQKNYLALIPVFLLIGKFALIRVCNSLGDQICHHEGAFACLPSSHDVRVYSMHEHVCSSLHSQFHCFLAISTVLELCVQICF